MSKAKIIYQGLLIGGMFWSIFFIGFFVSEIKSLSDSGEAMNTCLEVCNYNALELGESDKEIKNFYQFACNQGCLTHGMELLS